MIILTGQEGAGQDSCDLHAKLQHLERFGVMDLMRLAAVRAWLCLVLLGPWYRMKEDLATGSRSTCSCDSI
jgi:hypothetical protein